MHSICTLCTAWERIAIKSGLMIGLTVTIRTARNHSLLRMSTLETGRAGRQMRIAIALGQCERGDKWQN